MPCTVLVIIGGVGRKQEGNRECSLSVKVWYIYCSAIADVFCPKTARCSRRQWSRCSSRESRTSSDCV